MRNGETYAVLGGLECAGLAAGHVAGNVARLGRLLLGGRGRRRRRTIHLLRVRLCNNRAPAREAFQCTTNTDVDYKF